MKGLTTLIVIGVIALLFIMFMPNCEAKDIRRCIKQTCHTDVIFVPYQFDKSFTLVPMWIEDCNCLEYEELDGGSLEND